MFGKGKTPWGKKSDQIRGWTQGEGTTKGHKRTFGGDGDSFYFVLLVIRLNTLVKLIDL